MKEKERERQKERERKRHNKIQNTNNKIEYYFINGLSFVVLSWLISLSFVFVLGLCLPFPTKLSRPICILIVLGLR